ncbi:hypothetical protein BD289DRAFT_250790 [Coniella lustricola]|uniref:Uncharacterized protein n=1 Tax=Coniella lustricola TaxID=2025994 RepID=A0A2T3A8I3_9PEZI|nr:hypothetical protein BD289DRAFT_250790 [Coniella lustricola]
MDGRAPLFIVYLCIFVRLHTQRHTRFQIRYQVFGLSARRLKGLLNSSYCYYTAECTDCPLCTYQSILRPRVTTIDFHIAHLWVTLVSSCGIFVLFSS